MTLDLWILGYIFAGAVCFGFGWEREKDADLIPPLFAAAVFWPLCLSVALGAWLARRFTVAKEQ